MKIRSSASDASSVRIWIELRAELEESAVSECYWERMVTLARRTRKFVCLRQAGSTQTVSTVAFVDARLPIIHIACWSKKIDRKGMLFLVRIERGNGELAQVSGWRLERFLSEWQETVGC